MIEKFMIYWLVGMAVWGVLQWRRSRKRLAPRDPENLDPYGPQNHEVR